MSRYVVLAFDSNEDAERFCRDMITADEHRLAYGVPGSTAWKILRTELIALVARPTVFCDNSDNHRRGKTTSGWTRGKKLGWWICAKCKKPSKPWATSYSSVLSSGKNLLRPSEHHPRTVHIWDLPGEEPQPASAEQPLTAPKPPEAPPEASLPETQKEQPANVVKQPIVSASELPGDLRTAGRRVETVELPEQKD